MSVVAFAQAQGAAGGGSAVVKQSNPLPADAPVAPPADAPVVSAVPASGAPAAAGADNVAANSTIAELQQLIQSRSLNELRTTYNGHYGASLLFKPEDLTYYVAMFQQKNFWRVVKTVSESQAEQLYKTFVDQTVKLADVDIRTIKLDAERARTERVIAAQEARLGILQNDLTVQRQQEQEVAARQEQARKEAAALLTERQASRQQLDYLQRQIRSLETQKSRVAPITAQQPKRRAR
ncbi:DUF2968 domain-containing protein [Pigmentiphaga soli]|uniref:DUF2968 domain-containing protein n=1 Tax=Pigmentiphaga soli TaxID=1007095 RepID=UPI0031E800FD